MATRNDHERREIEGKRCRTWSTMSQGYPVEVERAKEFRENKQIGGMLFRKRMEGCHEGK
jgi:hypothetical protein